VAHRPARRPSTSTVLWRRRFLRGPTRARPTYVDVLAWFAFALALVVAPCVSAAAAPSAAGTPSLRESPPHLTTNQRLWCLDSANGQHVREVAVNLDLIADIPGTSVYLQGPPAKTLTYGEWVKQHPGDFAIACQHAGEVIGSELFKATHGIEDNRALDTGAGLLGGAALTAGAERRRSRAAARQSMSEKRASFSSAASSFIASVVQGQARDEDAARKMDAARIELVGAIEATRTRSPRWLRTFFDAVTKQLQDSQLSHPLENTVAANREALERKVSDIGNQVRALEALSTHPGAARVVGREKNKISRNGEGTK
jgi:hypothetical protein